MDAAPTQAIADDIAAHHVLNERFALETAHVLSSGTTSAMGHTIDESSLLSIAAAPAHKAVSFLTDGGLPLSIELD